MIDQVTFIIIINYYIIIIINYYIIGHIGRRAAGAARQQLAPGCDAGRGAAEAAGALQLVQLPDRRRLR